MKLGWLGVALCVALVCSPAMSVRRDGDKLEPEQVSIKGLNKFSILILNDEELQKSGLSTDKIRTDVELRMRAAGLPVVSMQESDQSPGHPFFEVSLTSLKSDDSYSYIIMLAMIQQMTFKRDPNIETTSWVDSNVNEKGMMCHTWHSISLGKSKIDNIQSIRENIKDEVDAFALEYLKANPKNADARKSVVKPRDGDAL